MVYDGARASCSDPNSCSIGIAFQQAVQDHHTSGGGGDSCSSVVGLASGLFGASVNYCSPSISNIPPTDVNCGAQLLLVAGKFTGSGEASGVPGRVLGGIIRV